MLEKVTFFLLGKRNQESRGKSKIFLTSLTVFCVFLLVVIWIKLCFFEDSNANKIQASSRQSQASAESNELIIKFKGNNDIY